MVVYFGYSLFGFLTTPSNFNDGGGTAWGGLAMIALLFWGVLFWLVDVAMRKLIPRTEVIWTIQSLVLLAMYLFLHW